MALILTTKKNLITQAKSIKRNAYTSVTSWSNLNDNSFKVAPIIASEIPKWGKMYIISNVDPNSDLLAGHAWLRFENRNGQVTTMSLWENPLNSPNELKFNEELDDGYGKVSKVYTINVSQYEQIIQYNSNIVNIDWNPWNTCAGYSVKLWNYITGDNLSASDILGITTPRSLSASIKNDP
jgi:hypothetical protein